MAAPAPAQAQRAAVLTADGPGRWRASGALTFATARQAAREGEQALAQGGAAALTVDCSGIGGCDSAGLAVLIEWMAHVRAAGGSLRYSGVPERLLALARISEVEHLLEGRSAD